jgi:hypothetical protein
VLRRQAVVDAQNFGGGGVREDTAERVGLIEAADDPAATMEVDDQRRVGDRRRRLVAPRRDRVPAA